MKYLQQTCFQPKMYEAVKDFVYEPHVKLNIVCNEACAFGVLNIRIVHALCLAVHS